MSIGKKIALYALGVVLVLLAGTWFFYEEFKVSTEPNYPAHTEYFYVEDYSGVLNENTESFIMDEAVRLNKKTKAQVVVVTVPNTQDVALEEFSRTLANNWGIGDAQLDNGVLLLFVTDPDDLHVRMEVGKGLEGALPDGKAGRILDDYAVGPKDDGKWNKAAGDTFVATVSEVYDEYGISAPKSLAPQKWENSKAPTAGTFADADYPKPTIVENEAPFWTQVAEAFLMTVIILFLFGLGFLLVSLINFIINKLFGGRGSRYYRRGGGGFFGDGGGFSGGGFSGGGGSFGGGGASR